MKDVIKSVRKTRERNLLLTIKKREGEEVERVKRLLGSKIKTAAVKRRS